MRARLLLFILPILLMACSAPDIIEEERTLFETQIANNPRVSKHQLKVGEDTLFYASAGDTQKPALIIIHGTPGSWKQYARYLLDERLLEHFYMIVVDRPGWGKSTLGGDKKIASFQQQGNIFAALARVLKDGNQGQPVLLMGHSLGSSIAPRAAMDHPDEIDGLLLFAGTLDPQLGKPRWFNTLAKYSGISLLLSDNMALANQEIFALKENLDAMSPLWADLQAQTLVVQGMKDGLVHPENIDYAENVLNSEQSSTIRLEGEGHLFPMSRREEVANWAICLLKRVQGEASNCKS